MPKGVFIIVALTSSLSAYAKMPENECYKLQTEVYTFAEDADSSDIENVKELFELSVKLTEECGYLMGDDVLKQRRDYNYNLYKKINGQ